MKIEIGLSGKERDGIIKILKRLLADYNILGSKTRKFHWNVTGPHFSELHAFFETLYTGLALHIDEVAERIRALGEVAPGTLKEFLESSQLKEHPGKNPEANAMLRELLSDYESIIQSLRKDVDACDEFHDSGTADFLTGLMEGHEKTAWMIRSHIK